MKISEAFLVDTQLFDSLIEELVKLEKPVPAITSGLLEEMGYVDLNARLLVKILKELDIITADGKPGELFDEFSNPATTKIALAKGLVNSYESLLDEDPLIHHKDPREINRKFTEIFGEKKTELIIRYMSDTFVKIASYCGTSVVDVVLQNSAPQVLAHAEINGQAGDYANGHTNGSLPGKSVNGDENYSRVFEDIGIKSVDDIIRKFDNSRKKTSSEFFDEEDSPKEEIRNKDDIDDKKDDDIFSVNPVSPQNGVDNHPKENATSTPADRDKNSGETEETNSFDLASPQPADNDAEMIQKAIIQRAELFYKLQRWEDLIPALNQLIKKYEHTDNAKFADVVSKSIIRRAKALLKLERFDKALPALDAIIKRLKDSEVKEFYHQASLAMLYKAQLIENDGSNPDLLPLYNSIINRLDDHSNTLIKKKVDAIHFKRFDIIIENGEKQDILKCSTELVKRFRDETENTECLKLAMIKRAEILEEMGSDEEALKAYEEFLKIFG